jgi:hypothetical protein
VMSVLAGCQLVELHRQHVHQRLAGQGQPQAEGQQVTGQLAAVLVAGKRQ